MVVTYAVVGAGGWTGRACLEVLLHTGYNARAVVRDPERAKACYRSQPTLNGLSLKSIPVGERLEIVQGDVTDPDSLRRALAGCAGIIYTATSSGWMQLSSFWRTLRTTSPQAVDCQGVKNVADVARELGSVQRIVLVSARMVTPARNFHPARIICNFLFRWRLMDWKYRGEQLLRSSGVPYTIVRPDLITAKPSQPTLLIVEQGDQNNEWQSTSVADLATVCVAALTDPSAESVTLELFSKQLPAGEQAPPLEQQVKSVFCSLQRDCGD